MLLKINGPKRYFWQWDLDRQLIVGEDTCGEVHFCNGTTKHALVCEIYQQGGQRLVNVPNVLLQQARPLTAYLYRKGSDGRLTRHQQTFSVMARNKPEDYVYTETETKTWDALAEEIRTLIAEDEVLVRDVRAALDEEKVMADQVRAALDEEKVMADQVRTLIEDAPVRGVDYWTKTDKSEIINDVLAAMPTWTGGNF